MTGKLRILCCRDFEPEVRAVVAAEGWSDVGVAVYPAGCRRSPMAWDELRLLVGNDCSHVVMLGCAALERTRLSEAAPPATGRPPAGGSDETRHALARLVADWRLGGGAWPAGESVVSPGPPDAEVTACAVIREGGERCPFVPAPVTAAPLAGLTLLLVEDNEINQAVAQRMLESAGATVEVAFDGQEALDTLSATPARFAVVLMDIQMPGMDGYEATAAIRGRPELSGLPVIAMTAGSLPADRERALAAGMNDHIPKPLDIEQLLTAIAACGRGAPVPPVAPVSAVRREFDLDQALKRASGDDALLREVLTDFARDFAATDRALDTALKAEDLADVVRIAHTLQGVTANLGANTLSAIAGALQIAARRNDGARAERLSQEVGRLLRLILAEVSEYLESGGGREG